MSAKAIKILRIVLCAAVVIFVLCRVVGCIVRRTTAEFEGSKLKIAGVTYVHKEFTYAGTDRSIAYVDGWDVLPVEEDPSRTFLRVRSFLDGYGYVREDYEIPCEGEITVVYLHGGLRRYTNTRLCEIVASLADNPPAEKFTIRTDNIYALTEQVTVGYEGCPVGTDSVGYIGIVNNVWVFIPPVPYAADNTVYDCHVIPDEYVEFLSEIPYFANKTAEVLPPTEADQ